MPAAPRVRHACHCNVIIRVWGTRYQQCADDTQLLSMRADDSAQGIDILRSCSKAVRDWYFSNNLLLNADKSEVIVLGTANQLRLATTIDSVEVAGATLPVAPTLKSLGVILDQRLTFDDHAIAVVKTCNFHIRAIRHVRHLLPESTALTLACSLINSRLDYCNALLYGAPASTSVSCKECKTTQLVWFWQQVVAVMPSHCFASSTGCQCVNASCTRRR